MRLACLALGLLASLALDAEALPRDSQLSALLGKGELAALITAADGWMQRCRADASAADCYQAGWAHYLVASAHMGADRERAGASAAACGEALAMHRKDADLGVENEALLAGCYGLAIGLNPMKGMSLGPESARMLAQAQAAQPNNPRVIYFEAQRLKNTPKQWGGDPAKALQLAQQAKALDASAAKAGLPAWGSSELEALIRQLTPAQPAAD